MTFNWTGDLEDDCFCTVGDFTAHCECLCDSLEVNDREDRTEKPFAIEMWFVGVYRNYIPPAKDSDILFHSGECKGMIASGEMARAIAEAILRGWARLVTGKPRKGAGGACRR